ncbi:MAG: hypothetical protein NTX33_17440 [Propionibacteriales bacterium]|nr:hypothetical protein [Propionibacteriales bacterium]
MSLRFVAAAAAFLVAATGCRATEWPSDADQAEFCALVTSDAGPGDQLVELHRLGTPEDLPFEARRYLLDLDEGKIPDEVGEQAFTTYVADHC